MPQKTTSEPKRYCKYCNCDSPTRALAPIGTARNNGKRTHEDWGSRDMHKKCYKAQMSGLHLTELINRMDNKYNFPARS